MTTVTADVDVADAAGADSEVFMTLALPQVASSNAKTDIVVVNARTQW